MPTAIRPPRRVPRNSGTVYLLHFAEQYHHARHYVGYTEDLPGRLAEHRSGGGSRLLAAVTAAGIAFEVAWTWSGTTRAFERKIHRYKKTPALCPVCTHSDEHARRYAPRPAHVAGD